MKTDKLLKKGTDEEVLLEFMKYMSSSRIRVATELIQDKNGFFTHEVLQIHCGDKVLNSPPNVLDWPLEPVVWPEEKSIN